MVCGLASLGTGALAAGADTSIDPSIASLYVGEAKIVEGTVVTAQRDGNTVRLTLGTPPQPLTVSLILGMLTNFPPDPAHYYLGKTIRVAGTIRSFRGAPEMVIHDPADIVVVGAGLPPPAPAAGAERAAAPANVPPTGTTIERLEARVRSLEERVRQLEASQPAP